MATGTYPDRHGIVDNRFFDREQGLYLNRADANWLQAEPLWIAAERQGVPAATYFWVGSETDWHGQGTRYRIAPFDRARPEAQKVDQILAWLRLPEAERPRLIMSYWAGVDDVSHDYGPRSPRVRAQLADQDAQLERLLTGLDELNAWPYTTLLLVSDHGMTETGAYLDLQAALGDHDISARVLGSPVAHVFLQDQRQKEAAKAAILSLGPVQVYEGERLPDDLRLRHPTRTGDLVVVTVPPYVLSRPEGLEGLVVGLLSALGWTSGGHGYDPSLPDMGAVFMAMGRGVDPGTQVTEARQIDIAPTVARLLGIQPPLQSEGRPVPGIGQAALPALSPAGGFLSQER
jgi:predicted AlkP superfamily pyrophosphatase or phosphodiesterase